MYDNDQRRRSLQLEPGCIHTSLQRSCVTDVSITYLPQLNATHCSSSSLSCSTAMQQVAQRRKYDHCATLIPQRDADAVEYERSFNKGDPSGTKYGQKSADWENWDFVTFKISTMYAHMTRLVAPKSPYVWKKVGWGFEKKSGGGLKKSWAGVGDCGGLEQTPSSVQITHLLNVWFI